MRSPIAVSCALLLVALVALAATPPLAGETAQAEPERSRVALGKSAYRTYCASCHGVEARGDGPVAEVLEIPPADLTTLAARHDGTFPAERVHAIIDGREVRAHGRQDMPVWGDALRIASGSDDEDEVRERITDLVHFLWSLQRPADEAPAGDDAAEPAGDG